jgi:hypothetical protein
VFSLHTPLGIVSSNRIIQGSSPATSHFSAVMLDAFQDLLDSLIAWIDDYLAHAKTEDGLLAVRDRFLARCRVLALKLNILKCDLYLRVAKFCGRLIDGDGIRFDTRCLETILQMQRPATVGDLQQLLCAAGWMRTAVPEFARVVAPMNDLLEVYKKVNSRRRAKVRNVALTEWKTQCQDAYQV